MNTQASSHTQPEPPSHVGDQPQALHRGGTQASQSPTSTHTVIDSRPALLANPTKYQRAALPAREQVAALPAQDTRDALLGTEDMALVCYYTLLYTTMAALMRAPYTAKQHHGTRPPDLKKMDIKSRIEQWPSKCMTQH